ncbi:MAG: response regulator [Bacillota bacterium]
MLKAIVVDDEKLALDDLVYLLEETKKITVIGKFFSPVAAQNFVLDGAKPDVAFLDIQMAEMNGLDLAEGLIERGSGIKIVFVTAYNEHAVEAFALNALDYLLKPTDLQRVEKTVDRLIVNSPVTVNSQKKVAVKLFGRFSLTVDDRPMKWHSRKAEELLALLVVNEGQPIHKEKLCEMLWGDDFQAKTIINLQTTMFRVRQSLEQLGCKTKITCRNSCYCLDARDWRSDLSQLQQLLQEKPINVTKIKQIYQSGFLVENGWSWTREYSARYDMLLIDKGIELSD